MSLLPSTPTPHSPAADAPAGLRRRHFLGIVGASLAAAAASLTGCIRKPEQHILPFARRPEDFIPGKPICYATVLQAGPGVLGVLVESQDGRPTKIEGNPRHSMVKPRPDPPPDPAMAAGKAVMLPDNDGGSNAWAQAAVFDLYDPDRSQTPRFGGKPAAWDGFERWLATARGRWQQTGGQGLALLGPRLPSPTFEQAVADLHQRWPQSRIYVHDPAHTSNARAGARIVGLQPVELLYELDRAEAILSMDADVLGVAGDAVRNARLWSDRRRSRTPDDQLNRLYIVEPSFSVTGVAADERLRLRSGLIGPLLAAVAIRLLGDRETAAAIPAALQEGLRRKAAAAAGQRRFVDAVAADLAGHRGQSLVMVGERQPPWVHGLGHLLNAALGNAHRTVLYVPAPAGPEDGDLAALVAAIRNHTVETLIIIDGNPVYDAPVDLGFATALGSVATSVHLGGYYDETASIATWHLPMSHTLESWGDLRAADGSVAIQQPLIAPLFDTRGPLELLALLAEPAKPDSYAMVRRLWQARAGGADFERQWKRWLHDGQAQVPRVTPGIPVFDWSGLQTALASEAAPAATGLELDLTLDAKVYDGRYANNPWLQELPEPLTKLTWDNAALLSPRTAEAQGVANGDRIRLQLGEKRLEAATFVAPGVADDVVVVPLGYGRSAGGQLAVGAGFNGYALRTTAAPWFDAGLTLQPLGEPYALVTTQPYGSLVEPFTGHRRSHVREATSTMYRKEPNFVRRDEVIADPAELRSLWIEPNETGGQQWGLSIDLAACIGCGVCTIACQAENNIATVGKPRVANGREMHWMRVDRYFVGDPHNPRAVMQPMPCQQCKNAPCEGVCPVAATAHSPDGLNDMAYNRCIGTRYCSNNCPFKVRRFNFFAYAKENDERGPLVRMQKNPDVTVRFRGVMEKCTYCIQRIHEARIRAKLTGDGVVADGQIMPACAQACPTRAIVFGDINDPHSQVSRTKQQPRNYALLSELNLHPRTTYLARIHHPNPELATS